MDKSEEKKALRKQLLDTRMGLPDRQTRSDLLQRVMRIWLVGRPDIVIGAYWPIKGEFDPLPALHRWKEDGELLEEPQRRRIGLPVVIEDDPWHPDRLHDRSGAGLWLVDAAATAWGALPWHGGKVVWATLAIDSQAPS